MSAPEGKLTAAQFELMEILWRSDDGLSVAELWDAIRNERDVSRTTVLNLVVRLEKRGWLLRRKIRGKYRYRPSLNRDDTQQQLVGEFVGDFFDGSAEGLVLSLLGSKKITDDELSRLKRRLSEASRERKTTRRKRSES